jgi:hypothetical protein
MCLAEMSSTITNDAYDTLALGQIFIVDHHQHEPQQSLSGNKPKIKIGKHPILRTDTL